MHFFLLCDRAAHWFNKTSVLHGTNLIRVVRNINDVAGTLPWSERDSLLAAAMQQKCINKSEKLSLFACDHKTVSNYFRN